MMQTFCSQTCDMFCWGWLIQYGDMDICYTWSAV